MELRLTSMRSVQYCRLCRGNGWIWFGCPCLFCTICTSRYITRYVTGISFQTYQVVHVCPSS